MRVFEVLSESVLLSSGASIWYVHFFKQSAHGQAIINSGVINLGSDGIVWAIRQGDGYNPSQIETDYDNGTPVARAGAVVFSAFDKPSSRFKGITGWDKPVECEFAYLVSSELGKQICNNHSIDKIDPIASYEYGN